MNILLAENLSKSYGEKDLFTNLTFGLDQGQKLALIAANGTGKSTLMRILAGTEDADTGQVTMRKNTRIAFLPQNPEFDPDHSLREALLDSSDPVMQLIREYEDCLEASHIHHSVEQQQKLDSLIEQMDKAGAWDYERKVTEILSRLGLEGINQKTGTLSGGQRKRLSLARVLIGEADILLLDEPTNHLDIQMIEWLEEYLTPQKLSLIMVTHDRYFLDRVCDEILELDRNTLFRYKGGYSYFLEKKSERLLNESTETERARNLYGRELEWMRRMPKARSTKAKARIESFYELEEKAQRRGPKEMIHFQTAVQRIGGKVLEMNNVSKKFGDLIVLDDFSYTFKKGERIGIAGPNGSGKSTLMNMICGSLKPDLGRISAGQTIQFGYYSQEGLDVKGDPRVIDLVKDIAEVVTMGKGTVSVSQFLNWFNFPHTLQYGYYSSLSGGEKRRLFLLTVLMRNPNFLILDEPTNDLDIDTLQILEEFLTTYPGCLMIVSHDRFFLDKLVDHIFVFNESGKVKDFYGSYSAYRHWKKQEESREQRERQQPEKISEQKAPASKDSTKASWKESREFETLGQRLEALEAEKEKVLERLNSGAGSAEELQQWSLRFAELTSEIEQCTDRWLELSEKISGA